MIKTRFEFTVPYSRINERGMARRAIVSYRKEATAQESVEDKDGKFTHVRDCAWTHGLFMDLWIVRIKIMWDTSDRKGVFKMKPF